MPSEMVNACAMTGNIVDLDVDFIVNAANTELWMGSGVAGAIKKAGGIQIEADAMKQAPIPHGGAALTSAGKLPHKGIIHVAAMHVNGLVTQESIQDSFRSIENILLSENAESVGIPALGTGVGGFELTQFVALAKKAVSKWRWPGRTVFVLYNDKNLSTFLQEWKLPACNQPCC